LEISAILQSSRYQHVAAIPDEVFEDGIKALKEAGQLVTAASVARLVGAKRAMPYFHGQIRRPLAALDPIARRSLVQAEEPRRGADER
jgi:hypothetical protein